MLNNLRQTVTSRSTDQTLRRARTENTGTVGIGGNITGALQRIDNAEQNPPRSAQEQLMAQSTDRETIDSRPAGSFGQPAQNVDATGRAVKEEHTKSIIPAVEKTYSNTDFLEHYKKGSGAPVTITPKEMDTISIFKKGIEQNQKSFENSILKGEVTGDEGTFKSPFKNMIETMKDGETIYLDKGKAGAGDYWDQDIKRWDAAKAGDIKQSMIIGSVKLRSQGRLKAERHGDKILITGIIDHKVNDTYNFNKEDFLLQPWEMLTHYGAKEFPIIGSRKDRVNAMLTIKDGKIIGQNFGWVPVDEIKNAKPD